MSILASPPIPDKRHTPLVTKNAHPVNTTPSINVGNYECAIWLQVIGKGTFANSPAIKSFCNKQLEAGQTQLIIDLGACTCMDSTFMGTLAGIAMRLAKNPDASFQIADANERNHESLEDLGLDCVMEINPLEANWRGHLDTIRESLTSYDDANQANAQLILEAHQKLCDADSNNNAKFDTVINVLKDQIDKEN